MDLSKTNLQNETKSSINYKLEGDQTGNCNVTDYLKPCSDGHETESHVDLNHKQIKTSKTKRFLNRSDSMMIHNMAMSSSVDVLNLKTNQIQEIEKKINLEDEIKKVLLPCSKFGTDKKMNYLHNENKLESSKGPEKAVENLEKELSFQKEIQKVEVTDIVGTTENITDINARNRKDIDNNTNKTKKRFRILLSRSKNLQRSKIIDGNGANGCYIEKNINATQMDASDTGEINSEMKLATKNRTCILDAQKPTNGLEFNISKTENNELSDKNISEESRFEEIEDKLEEMFAGIEDEQQLVNISSHDKDFSKISNDSMQKYLKAGCNFLNENGGSKFDDPMSKNVSPPTKAARKSNSPLSSSKNMDQFNLMVKDYLVPKSRFYLQNMPSRRRLAIGINNERINSEMNSSEMSTHKTDDIKSINNVLEKQANSTFNHENDKHISRNVLKNQIKSNNQKKCSKYKRDLSNTKRNCCGSKNLNCKSETPVNGKQSRLKFKQGMQNLSFSRNDFEEKQSQPKDIEIKNRSPFILVKSNGSIAVVNTVTPDDFNEKCSRSKKSSNYVHERKTVKGCHSSTLSNKYDADTADTSWKCVFCKLGPHEKSLGDLFGPYVISNDCDEYNIVKAYLQKFQKHQGNGEQLMMNYVVNSNDASNSNVQNISECKYEHLINVDTLGISQVSVDCYEVWTHEECAIWAPNIFVVGSRLAGLEEATWNSMRYECAYCSKQGALLCCFQRDCKTTSHVPCAREFKWLLNESKFWVYCSNHASQNFL